MTTAYRSRRVLLVVLGLVAVVLLAGLGPAAHADVAFTDINGTAVNVHLRLPDANTGNLIELPLPTDQLPAAASALLATPLSTLFDTYWSGTQDADGKTLRDHSCDGAVIQTAAAVARRPVAPRTTSPAISARPVLCGPRWCKGRTFPGLPLIPISRTATLSTAPGWF